MTARPVSLLIVIVLAGATAFSTRVNGQSAPSVPKATIVAAPLLTLPGDVDSNSPAVWDIEDGQRRLFVMTSSAGTPRISEGPSLEQLGGTEGVEFNTATSGMWMEAVVSDEVDTWYGFYHHEVPAIECGRPDRFVPRIGAARSFDRGRTWEDLGIVLEAADNSVACRSMNRYVIGGVGDLSVLLDASRTNLYIFFTQYQEQRSAQGVAVARLLWANRDQPVGRAEVWRGGVWQPPRIQRRGMTGGIDGDGSEPDWDYPVGTPLVPALQAWHDADGLVDAYWGPSVHWNSGIQQYVMLLNRAKDENYTQDGIYVSFAPRLDDPQLWSAPQRILTGGKWYPQVVGLMDGRGTDKFAGSIARLFVSGRSEWFITFAR